LRPRGTGQRNEPDPSQCGELEHNEGPYKGHTGLSSSRDWIPFFTPSPEDLNQLAAFQWELPRELSGTVQAESIKNIGNP
jgi:hypothetical protein